MRGQRHSDAGQQRSEQRRQAQECLTAIECAAQILLRLLDGNQLAAVGFVRFYKCGEVRNGTFVASCHHSIARAAANSEQPTAARVVERHNDARCQREQFATIRFAFDFAFDAQRAVADLDRVAGFQVECGEQAMFGEHTAS